MNKTRQLFLLCFLLFTGLFAYNWYVDEVIIEYENGTYVGEVSLGRVVWNGVPHGQGTYTFGSGSRLGDIYVGEFKDGKKHVQGTYTYADGSTYVGEHKDDKFHGQGTYTYTSGSKYVGEHKDDQKDGQGTYTYADGYKYVGGWNDGNQWNGTEYDKDGNVTGTFADGVKTEK